MKIHPLIAGAVISAMLTIQGWLLLETVRLREQVSMLAVKMQMHIEMTSTQPTQKNKI